MNRLLMKAISAVAVTSTALFVGGTTVTAASQKADNGARSKAANAAKTFQGAEQGQRAKSDSGNRWCGKYCAGGGGNITPQKQHLDQKAKTRQYAESKARATQRNKNVSAPFWLDGKDKHGKDKHHGKDDHRSKDGHHDGDWSWWTWGPAHQSGSNHADSKAHNSAFTGQSASQDQSARSSSGNTGCWRYCSGGGGNLTPQDQHLGQHAGTDQWSGSKAKASQHNLNVNAPTTIAHKGKSKGGGDGGAKQVAENGAKSSAGNKATTKQDASQGQKASSSSGNKGCEKYCTGGGGNITPQKQSLDQEAKTHQGAESLGLAKQELLNVNVPVTVVGWGSVGHAGGSAKQVADNGATSSATNAAATKQGAEQGQQANSSSGNTGCEKYCTGGGGNITPQKQSLDQAANTTQNASSAAVAGQQVLNVNVPVTVVGWGSVGVAGGDATQFADNAAASTAGNTAFTGQWAGQSQQANSSSGNTGCSAYCTGGGGNITPQSQSLDQHAGTNQGASSEGVANQGAANTNSPVTVG